jgi:hypothetical protein
MLKIKDNVDLEVLRKFGFKKEQITFTNEIVYVYSDTHSTLYVIVESKTNTKRSIKLMGKDVCLSYFALPKLFDLIQAGLVEKVEVNDAKN